LAVRVRARRSWMTGAVSRPISRAVSAAATLALYVFVQSIYGLFNGHSAETAWWGVAVTAIAAFGMPVVAKAKLRLAEAIDSRALRADAVETLTCGYLAIATLGGLLANALLHWWWLDGVACHCLVPFLVKEGREAIRGECCEHDCVKK